MNVTNFAVTWLAVRMIVIVSMIMTVIMSAARAVHVLLIFRVDQRRMKLAFNRNRHFARAVLVFE